MTQHSWHDPHIVQAKKSLLESLYISFGCFLFLSVLLHIGGALYSSSLATQASTSFNAGIASDLAYLKTEGDAIATNPLIHEYILSNDSEKLHDLLLSEKNTRGIGLMGITDSEGIIITRTKSTSRVGDNVFLTNPVGRKVAEGNAAASVEAPVGFDPHQIFLTTGRPVIQGGVMIGGLFANYLADNDYAKKFRDNYLPYGSELVFYNKEAGLYGNSFADPETIKLVSSYFNSGSKWIKNGHSDTTVSFKNGDYYLVKNITFPGLETSPGGALIFTPRKDFSFIMNIFVALFTLVVFLFCASRHHFRSRKEERGWRYYVLLSSMSIPIFILIVILLTMKNSGYTKLEHIPYPLYNSTLRMQPEFGIYNLGVEQRFTVVADTGDESINAIQIELSYDPQAVEIKELNTDTSACSYIIEKTIDQASGTASLGCAIVDNTGSGSLPVVQVITKPLRTGSFTLSFNKSGTKVLANDGIGTDVLRMSQSGSYRVDDFDPIVTGKNENTESAIKRAFIVFSPTHPNQSRWYNTDTARFVWRGKPQAIYTYEFDTTPDTIPTKRYVTKGLGVTVPLSGDGIFYFHLQLAGGGPVAHYRIQVDRTPPSITTMNLSSEEISKGDVARLSFNATDTGSGIQKNYYVDFGNHLFLPTGSYIFIPFLEIGDKKITLRVYDDAENYAEASKTVWVTK